MTLKRNLAYPAIPEPNNNNIIEVLEAMKEAIEIHERQRGRREDSFVKVSELDGMEPTTNAAAVNFVANTSNISDDTATFDGYTLGEIVKALKNVGILT